MKFEFCGKRDCPDWILAQLFHASRLDLPRFKLICESVIETILSDGNLDQSLFDCLELDDEQFDIDDARACFGSLNHIITNACTYGVSSKTLNIELEQLGLPREHCLILVNALDSRLNELRKHI